MTSRSALLILGPKLFKTETFMMKLSQEGLVTQTHKPLNNVPRKNPPFLLSFKTVHQNVRNAPISVRCQPPNFAAIWKCQLRHSSDRSPRRKQVTEAYLRKGKKIS